MSEPEYYGTVDGVKERALIATNDDQYDSFIESALVEASAFIDTKLSPYETELPLEEVPEQINIIACDIATGIFKRRHMPQAMDEGWWGQGIKKLEDYIKATYYRGVIIFPDDVEEEE